MKTVCFAMFCVTALSQDPAQTGSIGGVVTDAVTHLPVKKAMVSLNTREIFGGRPNNGPLSSVTDASGAFTISNLTPTRYYVIVQHSNYPQVRFGMVRKTVDVKAGEKAGPVEVELIPAATVTGHVLDEDGDPMTGCTVEARRGATGFAGSGISNTQVSVEDGSYRLYNVPPAKYILSARCRQPAFQARPFSQGPELPPSAAYPVQYYPATYDAKSAEVVDLAPGSEKAGVEFRMHPAPVTQIRGKYDTSADLNGAAVALQLLPAEEKAPVTFPMNVTNPIIDRDKGTFEFQQVFPGSYMLVAFTNSGPDHGVGAIQRVEVRDRPVETVVNLRPAMKIEGTVQMEGNANASPGRQVSVQSLGAPSSTHQMTQVFLTQEYQFGFGTPESAVKEDGTFTLPGILPGFYRVNVESPNGYLKSAWLGTTDVTDSLIDLSAGVPAALRLVISTDTATIRGTGPAGQIIFAQDLKKSALSRVPNFRTVPVDQSGQFKIEGLAPGNYRVGASGPDGAMPEEGGQEITLHESETLMIEVKAPSN
jgi:carboxypeptidase family protein